MIAAAVIACSIPTAAARGGETTWTSIDGVTIWARLVGWDGSNVIIFRNGRDYKVPAGRLTPESADKARRLLGMEVKHPAASRIAGNPPKTGRGIHGESAPAPVLAKGPQTRLPDPAPEAVTLPAGTLEELSLLAKQAHDGLPGFPESGEIDSSGFTSVLPEREPETAPSEGLPAESEVIRLEGRLAIPPASVPSPVKVAIAAANRLQTKPYKWGGGHGRSEDSGYDCSGSVSYVLMKAGLLRSPGTSRSLMHYGEPGPGRWITVYARNGHAFMTICGIRLDTGGSGGRGESGPRWRIHGRCPAGFVMRHPPGL